MKKKKTYLPLIWAQNAEREKEDYNRSMMCTEDRYPDIINACLHKDFGFNYTGIGEEISKRVYEPAIQDFIRMHAGEQADVIAEWRDFCCLTPLLVEWSKTKQVYIPDREFAEELMLTENVKIPVDVLKHLPFLPVYFDLSRLNMSNCSGLFATLEFYDDFMGIVIYRMTQTENGTDIVFSTYLDFSYVKENGLDLIVLEKDKMKEIFPEWREFTDITAGDQEPAYGQMDSTDDLKLVFLAFQLFSYLAAEKPEIQESETTKKTYRPFKTVHNKFSEIRQYELGYVYGSRIRAFRKAQEKKNQKEDDFPIASGKARRSPRPHVRRAHWQHFRVGKGRKEVILRWVAPSYVGEQRADMPAVLHIVDNLQ